MNHDEYNYHELQFIEYTAGTSGSRTSETGGGGPNFCRHFLTTLIKVVKKLIF